MSDSRLTGRRRRRPRQRLRQKLRAFRHHVLALIQEFRGPIAAFVLVTVGGGFLYGELYRSARGEVIPLIDRPYIMVQLMILEAPEAVPPEWYLAAFWYGLPVAFIVILGLGAADFVDLFFNRGDDEDRWAEALAMTYRNHVIVLGAGHVGLRVVRDLVDLGLEVVVVDERPDPEAAEHLEEVGVPVVRGDGRRASSLATAGIRDAEAFIACTGDDQVNLESAMQAREMKPDLRIVSRAWDRTIARRMSRFVGVQTVLSAADLSAPAFAGAALGVEITQTLELGDTEYSTVRLRVLPGSILAGRLVGDLEREHGMDIVLARTDGGSVVDPGPDREVGEGDELVLFAPHERALDVVAGNRSGRRRKGARA